MFFSNHRVVFSTTKTDKLITGFASAVSSCKTFFRPKIPFSRLTLIYDFSEQEGEKERDKFVKRFTPHIYNISPTALYESLQIVIGPRASNMTFSTVNCLTDSNKSISNSIRIRDIDSPPASIPQSTRVTQKALNSLTFTSSLSASTSLRNSSEKSTVSLHTTQTIPQKLETTPQRPINTFITKLTSGANVQSVPTVQSVQTVQSSPLVQIQTLPTQIVAQPPASSGTGSAGHPKSLSSNPSVINLLTHSPAVSLSYVNTSQENQSHVNNTSLMSGHFGSFSNLNIISNVSNVSKQTTDLTQFLGATVLTFDSQNRPLLSVYSPSFAAAENCSKHKNINSEKNEEQSSLSVNSCPESVASDVCSPMDTSFYSPNQAKSAKPQSSPTGLQVADEYMWPNSGNNFDETSNHSANSLLDFPSNVSQCE